MREGIQPEDRISNKLNHHDKPQDVLKWQQVVPAARLVLDGVDIVLDLWDMFILCTQVKGDIAKSQLECLEFWVGQDSSYVEPPPMVQLDHVAEGSADGCNLLIREILHSAGMETVQDGD
jgi:hypothetical protein